MALATCAKAANTVCVTVQLLIASNGVHVWAEAYERVLNPENLFAVQDDIVLQVVARIGDIHGALNQADIQMLRTRSIASLDVRFPEAERRERGLVSPMGCANRAL